MAGTAPPGVLRGPAVLVSFPLLVAVVAFWTFSLVACATHNNRRAVR